MMLISGARWPASMPFPRLVFLLSPLYLDSCALFCTCENHNSFLFMGLRTPLQKTGGGGIMATVGKLLKRCEIPLFASPIALRNSS